MTPDEVSSLLERLRRLEEERDAARLQADQWRQVAEERRVVLERLRQHPVIRVLMAIRARLWPVLNLVARMRDPVEALTTRGRRVVGALQAFRLQHGVRRRRRRFQERCRELDRRDAPQSGLTASLVVVTRDGGPDLPALLSALDAAMTGIDGDVIVVDNGGGHVAGLLEGWAGRRRGVVTMPEPSSFSAANNAGAARAKGDVVCFLNDDVVPAHRDWLVELLRPLESPDIVAVGAQLLYAPQPAMQRRFGDFSVQHLGVRMKWRGADVPRPVNVSAPSVVVSDQQIDVPAVTAACMAVRRAAFERIGGFDEGFDFGAEDVDLCLRLGRYGSVVVAPTALLLHLEGATRRQDDARRRQARQRGNWVRFESLHGPRLWHEVARDRVEGRLALADRPLRVAITVTRDDPGLPYGDVVTAHRLGAALGAIGYEVEFIERYRDAWYDLAPTVDVVIALLDTFDVRRVARPGLLVVAWIRNWESRWIAHPWAEAYDLVLTSGDTSVIAAAFEAWGTPVAQMPLAPASTPPHVAEPDARTGVIAPLNHWGDDRGVPALVASVPGIELYGSGWEQMPEVAPAWKGAVAPQDVHELYRRAEIVVDLSAPHTAAGGSINARVFDALAHGAIVVSNQPGVRRLFGDDVPVFGSPTELRDILDAHAEDPRPLRDAAHRARLQVLREHTWELRGQQVVAHLAELVARPRVAFLTAAPEGEAGRTWGDTHLAHAFANAMQRRGVRAGVVAQAAWRASSTRAADVTVHLKGRGRGPVTRAQVNALWVISHPEEVADDELEEVDIVLAASRRLVDHFRLRTTTPVELLRQATDARRFHPTAVKEEFRAPVVFVGNSRFAERPVISAAVNAGLDLVVHGGNWERFLPAGVIGRDWIPNELVPSVYSSADVVLNDHWNSMREWGLVSNRVFDALACAACVVSDDVDELQELFPGGLVVLGQPTDVGPVVRGLLEDPDKRHRLGSTGLRLVLDGHTFDHRAEEFEGILADCVGWHVGDRHDGS